jgi:diaminopimelate decarboxylase
MKILYYNTNGELCLENVNLQSLIANIPTPFYIYSQSEIEKNCREILSHIGSLSFLPCYALKANYNPAILKIIKQMNFGADVVSGGELFFAKKIGIPVKKIVFAGVGKSAEEIETSIKDGIHSLNVESEAELSLVAKIAERLKKNVVISVRVNPDIDAGAHPYISTGLLTSKFGVDRDKALSLYQKAAKYTYIKPLGIHVHIGSQISSVKPFIETAHFLDQLIDDLAKIDIQIQYLDLGGGIGIDYENQLNSEGNPRTYINDILPKLLHPLRNRKLKILIELGRSVVGSAGLLISKIQYVKKTPEKKFYIIDAAMNNLIRPSLYNAHHQIVPLAKTDIGIELVDVVGPVCETSDFLAKDRKLPILKAGDYLAITGAGAYGQALSSNYNLRPRIAEYLVKESQVQPIYKAETLDDLASKYNL